ncbi:MAG: ABC transporter substrate-binding protein, partial [Spirochaetota bacterium]
MKKPMLVLITLLLTVMLAFAGGGQEPSEDAQVVPDAPEEQLTESGLPRSETVIAAMLTGRVGSPSNFNEWVGWKNRDRGMQQLMNE